MLTGRKNDLTLLGLQSRFGDNWGQITWNLSALFPKRDWSPKWVNVKNRHNLIQHKNTAVAAEAVCTPSVSDGNGVLGDIPPVICWSLVCLLLCDRCLFHRNPYDTSEKPTSVHVYSRVLLLQYSYLVCIYSGGGFGRCIQRAENGRGAR